MRLIDTKSLRVREFFNSNRPKYAILSHTWRGEEEVSLQEWMKWEEGDTNQKIKIEAKSGFKKIKSACRLALSDGHQYIWVDTNCIDKKSSAELSEAINSMFSWYRGSEICYAFLEDFPGDTLTKDISRCRWFTRGWTLQELLAPERLEFFDATWQSCGTKFSLCEKLSKATGIDAKTFREPTSIGLTCVARKMSWASSRETTRVEDMAYCLLGLFDISMPLLYGEGIHAFRRLQEEIIKVSTDQSIFAWNFHGEERLGKFTALATSPLAYGTCRHIEKRSYRALAFQPRQREFAMTNFDHEEAGTHCFFINTNELGLTVQSKILVQTAYPGPRLPV
ncbi:Vegetative incompatibility protein HET-E-1 [Colletotrichum siamense]|uniref:Vegetative incompatibility protein HET-E-1 n=1 Tax=Colletotrichum siamense TaxID=690259 RepID=A0A9P5KB20_COLSI|nr:Vegetative incompatibility protein HET-E-1 [Colletotrichum siamense]KAF4867040.1 Vegetative incompatibility protein HET-E-1 [Colletotrichum siamense]